MQRKEAAAIAATVVKATMDNRQADVLAMIGTFSADDYLTVFLEMSYMCGGVLRFFDDVSKQQGWPGTSDQILSQIAIDADA